MLRETNLNFSHAIGADQSSIEIEIDFLHVFQDALTIPTSPHFQPTHVGVSNLVSMLPFSATPLRRIAFSTYSQHLIFSSRVQATHMIEIIGVVCRVHFRLDKIDGNVAPLEDALHVRDHLGTYAFRVSSQRWSIG